VFLREVVWPVARKSALIHDSCFKVPGAKKFPKNAVMAEGRHVGQNASSFPFLKFGRLAVSQGPDKGAKGRPPRQNYIFTLTTGRSGTAFLAELLRKNLVNSEVHHERTGFSNFGKWTPDASHFTLFNSEGNVPSVQEFWLRKFSALRISRGSVYAETSHFLAKAGLLENIAFLGSDAKVRIVILNRDTESLIWSFANRMDFANRGFTWLFALDPGYPRNIVEFSPFEKYGMIGFCYWYIIEMRARAIYYQKLFKQQRNITFHNISIEELKSVDSIANFLESLDFLKKKKKFYMPDKTNPLKQEILSGGHRKGIGDMISQVQIDPKKIAEKYFESGRRIGGIEKTK
jgi:hypothetical protein